MLKTPYPNQQEHHTDTGAQTNLAYSDHEKLQSRNDKTQDNKS